MTKIIIAMVVAGFVMPAIIINSLQFLGFSVVWTVWSHLFVYLDLLVLSSVITGAVRVQNQALVARYMEITKAAMSNVMKG